jgi:membrane-associated phospholipid phosphatase
MTILVAGRDAGREVPWRATVRRFDDRVERWVAARRGRPLLDAAAKIASGLGDHGLLWAIVSAWRARRPGEGARALRNLAVTGIESTVVNAALKKSIGRERPDRLDLQLAAGIVPVRAPTSASFPSGHTLAAFCAATVLAERDHPLSTVLLFSAAGTIAASRLHLGAHHASDVAGGAAIGIALGWLGRRHI